MEYDSEVKNVIWGFGGFIWGAWFATAVFLVVSCCTGCEEPQDGDCPDGQCPYEYDCQYSGPVCER